MRPRARGRRVFPTDPRALHPGMRSSATLRDPPPSHRTASYLLRPVRGGVEKVIEFREHSELRARASRTGSWGCGGDDGNRRAAHHSGPRGGSAHAQCRFPAPPQPIRRAPGPGPLPAHARGRASGGRSGGCWSCSSFFIAARRTLARSAARRVSSASPWPLSLPSPGRRGSTVRPSTRACRAPAVCIHGFQARAT